MSNPFDCLASDDEDGEDECQDCMAWPVVGKGGKVSKGEKEGFAQGQRGAKFKKFDMTAKVEDVKFIGAVDKGGAAMSLCFQVTDVRKPLVAVKRIAQKGNVVQFDPAENDNFIQNELSGNKIL